LSPEDNRPHPKAAAHTIASGRGRRRASTAILTDTPEKLRLEEEIKVRVARGSPSWKTVAKRKLKFQRKASQKTEEVVTSESDISP
jgi:hypothetical protein